MEITNDRFFGRKRLLREIVAGVLAPQPASFSLVGPTLIGKSALLNHLTAPHGPLLAPAHAPDRPAPFADPGRIIVLKIDCDWHDAQENLLGHLCSQLTHRLRTVEQIQLEWDQVEAQSSDSSRIWQMSRQLHQHKYRLVVLIDNFDTVFADQVATPEAVEELRRLTLELALVVATEQPLHDLDRELTAAPLFNMMTQLFVGLIEADAARSWLRAYGERFPATAPATAFTADSGADVTTSVADSVRDFASDPLLEITGYHPYLLRRIGDILAEVEFMLTPGQPLGPNHLPLIRLRLAEHGRLLFVTLWQKLQNPPGHMDRRTVMALLEQLLSAPLTMDTVARSHFATLNWLINQAMVIYGPDGYRLFTPLFAEFLSSHLGMAALSGDTPAHAGEINGTFHDQLTKTESALLRYFQAHSMAVISPEQLLADVWKRPDASPRRVQEAIRRLRLQLEKAVPPVGVIENERGRGYRFVPAKE